MKLFSVLAFAVCSLALTGCLKDNTSGEDLYPVSDRGQVGGGISGSSCRAASTQMVDDSQTQSPCPSASGMWTRHQEFYSNGTLVANQIFCGYPQSDVTSSQAQWDSIGTGSGFTANQDYTSGADCASMSSTGGANTLVVIFTKTP